MRISCTTLESFRLFMEPEQEWMTDADLERTIRGEFHDSPEMALGRAFESVLMDPDRCRVGGGFRCDGYDFDAVAMQAAIDSVDRRGLFQVKTSARYDDVDVIAKCDHIVGAHIHEWKTTASTFDAEKYAASYQWRYMLDAFGAQLVTYHVWVLNDHGNGVVEIRDTHTLNVFPYAALHDDCVQLLRLFTDYVTVKGLDGVLRQRQAALPASAFA